jgi:hypothetical protein
MKLSLLLIPALLLASAPGAAVRFEAEGIRVGSELVTGNSVSLKEAGALPLLVSGSAVESLSGNGLAVALDGRQLTLGAGLRVARTSTGYLLSTHGGTFTATAGQGSLSAVRSAAFTLTETGFDFGALGTLEGASLAASLTAPAALAPAQDGKIEVSPEKPNASITKPVMRRAFSNGSPFVIAEAANSVSVVVLPKLTPEGAP